LGGVDHGPPRFCVQFIIIWIAALVCPLLGVISAETSQGLIKMAQKSSPAP
jgi:hypothetical protein